LKTIDVEGSVLDVGGSQNPIKGRTKSWDVDDYKTLDLETPHKGEKPDIVADIQYNFALILARRDVIFCIEVSEYWFDPLSALKNINQMLKRDGLLYISFHTLYGLHNPKGEDCLRYTKNAIIKLFNEAELKIVDMIPRTISDEGRVWLERFYRVEGMRLDYQHPETWDIGYLVKATK